MSCSNHEAVVGVLGGLPLIANVTWTKYWHPETEEWDAEVNALYWIKKDGSKGKEISQKIYDKLNKLDQYWQSHVIEQVEETISYQKHKNNPPGTQDQGG